MVEGLYCSYCAMYRMCLVCRGGQTLHTRHVLYIARYAAAPQPTNEVILLIFYKCSFSHVADHFITAG
jgi:hypothetical protein